MNKIFAASLVLVFGAFAALGQSANPDRWSKGKIATFPRTFTNGQASAIGVSSGAIKLNSSTLAPVGLVLKGTAGTNGEGRITITLGYSHDGENVRTNGTWVSLLTTSVSGVLSATNWVPGGVWPYLHIISASVATNTLTGAELFHVVPK